MSKLACKCLEEHHGIRASSLPTASYENNDILDHLALAEPPAGGSHTCQLRQDQQNYSAEFSPNC